MIVCSSKRPASASIITGPSLAFVDVCMKLLNKRLTFAYCTVDIAAIAIKYFEEKPFDEHLLPARLGSLPCTAFAQRCYRNGGWDAKNSCLCAATYNLHPLQTKPNMR